jgi:hypothetical protein
MANYVIAYRGGRKFETPQEGASYMARWTAWMDSLGDAIVDPGVPLGTGRLITSAGVSEPGPDRFTGFSIVAADGIEAAVQMASRCPHLDHGSIEVAEAMAMKMR